MANQKHINILSEGIGEWNDWRFLDPDVNPDLREVNLSGVNLSRANLSGVFFSGSNLSKADLSKSDLSLAYLNDTDLRGANLSNTNFFESNLSGADFRGANLNSSDFTGARLMQVNFSGTDLSKANFPGAFLLGSNMSNAQLRGTNLSGANLSNVNLSKADITGCRVFAISAWNVQLDETIQSNLIITGTLEPTIITVDNLEMAQFIYILMNNKKIREVIDTITSKVVLILGRFTPERKAVLDALKDELRRQNYSPVLFDFEKPASRDFTETIRTLALLARFIIADLTDPSSIPQELQAIVPDLEIPIQPILLEAKSEYSMFVDFRKYGWVLPTYLYKDRESLISSLKDEIIEPADRKARELAIEKEKRLERQ